jgi:LysM repeat protein
LRGEITPSGSDGYELKVPVGSRDAVLVAFAQAPTAKPPSFRRHVVQRGETLASIARRFHVTLASLASANSLQQHAKVSRGHVVLIPRQEPPVRVASNSRKAAAAKPSKRAAAPVEARNYKVRGGDTLYRIALKHGTTVAQLLAFNSLPGPAFIKPGDTLKIPARALGARDW